MSAASPPAYVALPVNSKQALHLLLEHQMKHTTKDVVDREEVGANGQNNHGEGEAHQLEDDGAVSYMSIDTADWGQENVRRDCGRDVGRSWGSPRIIVDVRLLFADYPSSRHRGCGSWGRPDCVRTLGSLYPNAVS
jgi:hypothetical protein